MRIGVWCINIEVSLYFVRYTKLTTRFNLSFIKLEYSGDRFFYNRGKVLSRVPLKVMLLSNIPYYGRGINNILNSKKVQFNLHVCQIVFIFDFVV